MPGTQRRRRPAPTSSKLDTIGDCQPRFGGVAAGRAAGRKLDINTNITGTGLSVSHFAAGVLSIPNTDS